MVEEDFNVGRRPGWRLVNVVDPRQGPPIARPVKDAPAPASGALGGYSIKPGVNLKGISPEIAFIKPDIMDVARGLDIPFVVTSALDGEHKAESLHYSGRAIDLRANHIKEEFAIKYARALAQRLGEQFDVVLERNKDGKVSHIHVEFDPPA